MTTDFLRFWSLKIGIALMAFFYHGVGYFWFSEFNNQRFIIEQQPTLDLMTRVDHWLSLVPQSVWFYWLYIPLLIITFLWLPTIQHTARFAIGFVTLSSLAWLGYGLVPAAIVHEPLNCAGLSCQALAHLRAIDAGVNLIPSLHSAHMVLVGYCILAIHNRWMKSIMLVLAGTVIVSTVLTKQHYLWDVVAGVVLAGIVCWLMARYFKTSPLASNRLR